MGDDGTMSKGAGYTPEFRAKAVGLLAEARGSCSSEARAVEQTARDPGVAPETLRRWRDKADARSRRRLGSRPGRDGGVEGFAGRGRAIEAGERDIDGGVGFFRGQARPGTALVVACVDGFRDRSRVGPACGAPAASPGCGFVTPRGCRVSRSGPVSRMTAGREAPARGILGAHAGFFMAVYGCRKTRARSSAQGRDPAAAGRAPPPWTPGGCHRGRRNRRHHGPPRTVTRTVSCTMPIMACGTSAPSAPPG